MVIFLRKRSFVSNTELTNEAHLLINTHSRLMLDSGGLKDIWNVHLVAR